MRSRPHCCFLALLCALALADCGGRHRPGGASTIAAGAPSAPIRLVNIVPSCGITFQYPPMPHPLGTKEAFGCGCAFLDYDGDGRQDVLLVAAPHPWLYRNLGGGRFGDVTHAVGLDKITGDWRGCAVGDYDGDGRLDILLTGFHRLALLRNLAGGGAGSSWKRPVRRAWTRATAGTGPAARASWA